MHISPTRVYFQCSFNFITPKRFRLSDGRSCNSGERRHLVRNEEILQPAERKGEELQARPQAPWPSLALLQIRDLHSHIEGDDKF